MSDEQHDDQAVDLVRDVDAERALLGSILWLGQSTGGAEPVIDAHLAPLPSAAFTGRGHEEIVRAINAVHARAGELVDPHTVLAELTARSALERTGGAVYLHTLIERAWQPSNAGAYAGHVARAYRRNQLRAAGVRLVQQAGRDDVDVAHAALQVMLDVEALTEPDAGSVPAPMALEDFLLGSEHPDWLVPGLLERGDRLILTAGEGGGKSVLIRQMAAAAAAGIHPFDFTAHDPLRVLMVDCENSPRLIRKWMRRLSDVADGHGRAIPAGGLRLISRPEGLDLTRPDDGGWLAERVAAADPQLLVIGPLYRLHTGSMHDEEAARGLVAVLDRMRARHGCALIMETHAPHAESAKLARNLRPYGSSLFMRWPEFGYGLRPVKDTDGVEVDVVAWRGARDERDWPRQLRRGGVGDWPWRRVLNEWGAA